MNRIPCTLAGLAFAIPALAVASPALAASDYYLEIEGVEGESSSRIDVESWSWGASGSATTERSANLNLSKSNLNLSKSNIDRDTQQPPKPDTIEAGRTGNLNSSKSNTFRATQPNEPLPENGSLSLVTAKKAPSTQAKATNLNSSRSNAYRQGQAGDGAGACTTGQHFARASLTGQGLRWELKNVMVSSCAADGMTLSYASATQIPSAPAETTVVKSKSNITNN